ncbi:hypothetical protein [Sphingomonas sp. CFBP 8765]|jgi:hypothetical protein|uniref:hypothetical protein n=1 Tax=Sphingomonas sp. CFBP 8765 TaxID=2775274 RepID=UPI00177FD62A|nr:hypothetical protein [Sphingomonas sp. CFBP 8765]MBD8471562.1 hypothetical protein [Sphingomonas sp. CFBP 8765]
MIHVTMPILHGVCTGLFIGGGATALGVIVATVAPEWQRICGLALGDVPATPPLLSKHFLQERRLAHPLDRPAAGGSA